MSSVALRRFEITFFLILTIKLSLLPRIIMIVATEEK